MPQTSAGIKYPTTQDPVADTDRYIRELESSANTALGQRRFVAKQMVANTDSGGYAWLNFPEFSTIQGCVVQYSHDNGQPVVIVLMTLSGNGAQVQLVKVWTATSNAPSTPNTTTHYASVSVWVTAFAWGVPA